MSWQGKPVLPHQGTDPDQPVRRTANTFQTSILSLTSEEHCPALVGDDLFALFGSLWLPRVMRSCDLFARNRFFDQFWNNATREDPY